MSNIVSKAIDQLDEITSPGADFLLVIKDPNGKDYKVTKANLLAGASTSFEWTPGATYAINEIREWQGKWWKSKENDNTGNIPDENTHWTQVDPADESSIKQFQADKVYKSDIVVVLYQNILRSLKSAITRPYSSALFVKNDWDNIVSTPIDFDVIDTTVTPIILDFKSISNKMFKGSDNITVNKVWQLSNTENAIMITSLRFNTNALVDHTFADFKMNDAQWDDLTKKWTPLFAGEYEGKASYDGISWLMKIEGPY